MRFYTISHKYYCGIDLHTKMMYVCILDSEANIVVHKLGRAIYYMMKRNDVFDMKYFFRTN